MMLLTYINVVLETYEKVTNIDLFTLFTFTFLIFVIGMVGTFINNKNLLIVLLCLELMLLAIGLNFIFTGLIINKLAPVFVLYIISVAAIESSIGLGLLIILYRINQSITVESLQKLKF